jgi:uncharacterized protein
LYDSVYSDIEKDTTGNLDEVQIENIAELKKYEVIVKRKEILKSIRARSDE